MNFKMVHINPPDGKWGDFDPKTKTWNGLMGQLVNFEADMAACGLTRTYERSLYADFSADMIEDVMTLVSGTPKGESINFTAYLFIFKDTVWIVIFVSVACVAFVMVIISANLIGETFHELNDSEKFTFNNAFASVLLTLGQLNYSLKRTKYSSKILFFFSSIFAFLIFAYYNAVLTSLMTSVPTTIKIRSFKDAVDAGLKVFVWKAGSAEHAMRNAEEGSYMKLAYEQMMSRPDEEKYVTSLQGTLNLLAKDPQFIHFGGSTSLKSFPQLTILDIEEKRHFSNSIGFQKGSEFKKMFDFYLLQIKQSGLFVKLENKWLEKGKVEPLNEVLEAISQAARPLGYDNLLFPFLSLIGGVSVAILLILLEKIIIHKIFLSNEKLISK